MRKSSGLGIIILKRLGGETNKMETGFISEWFEAGLVEIGLTKNEFLKLPISERNKVKKYLAELGHF